MSNSSAIAKRLDSLYEFDREPVAKNKLQGIGNFLGMYAGEHVADILKRIWLYLLIGIGIGAAIHSWAPEEILAKYAGSDNPLSVVIAVFCGLPLYANAIGTIPIAEALIGKGVGLGTALAFMMAVTALSVPEMVLLRKVMKPRLIAIFVATASIGILMVGWMFNLWF